MKNLNRNNAYSAVPGLKVSYKAAHNDALDRVFLSLQAPVFITGPDLRMKSWNQAAEGFFGIGSAGISGVSFQDLVPLTFTEGNWEHVFEDLEIRSSWEGMVQIKNEGMGYQQWQAKMHRVFDAAGSVQSIVIILSDSDTGRRPSSHKMATESKYRIVVESLSEGIMLMKPDLSIEACNTKAAEILGMQQQDIMGRKVSDPDWKAKREDGSDFPIDEFPAIKSMRTGMAFNDVIMGFFGDNGEEKWISINSRPIFRDNSPTPDAVVASFTDITSERLAWKKVQLSELMFRSFMKNSPSLAWVYDESGNLVYANPLFMNYIGISESSVGKNIYEFSEKPVAERIMSRNLEVLKTGQSQVTEDVLHIDGRDIHFIANWFLVPGKYGMMIGGQAIDVTEKKKLEKELMKEQLHQQILVNQAAIQAQEHERNMISAELHDNVNQLLISSRLFINIARNTPDQQDELLEKATNYLLMAVDEIRGLSRRMNSKVVGIVGLKESIMEIANNMCKHREMDVRLDIDETLSKNLSTQHQLMIFRIVQEQTSNILKHSEASEAVILLRHEGDMVNLRITDNGKGFDSSGQSAVKGIGMINISNRVNAYHGKMDMITSPGKGCSIDIHFPVEGLAAQLAQ